MTFSVVTMAERPDLIEPSDALGDVWPKYNNHGDVMNAWFWRVKEELPTFQLLFIEDATSEVVARGRTMPLRWDGSVSGLPAGIDGALEGGFRAIHAGVEPDTLCALAAEVRPDRQGTGLSGEVIKAMRELAQRHWLERGVIAPVRPSWKERYPLAPIERYITWRREDGLPFDPWMRVHARLGGVVLKPEPHSLRITGTVADWSEWVDMEFPESGAYVFPRGLAPVDIDLAADVGRYWEPNVWMQHP